jgi:hypothetical protein
MQSKKEAPLTGAALPEMTKTAPAKPAANVPAKENKQNPPANKNNPPKKK